MMNRFLCGRLTLNKDGTLKKLYLADGGGSRECTISHIDMGFEEIHDRVRGIFALDHTNCSSKLYDFQCKELDTNRYTTFYDYIQKNGLRFKGTLLYLFTSGDNGDVVVARTPEKRRTTTLTTRTPAPIITVPQVEADSSTPLVAVKSDADLPAIIELSVNNRRIEHVRRSSFSSYSFENSLNELTDHLRDLIHRYHHEQILIQLFEHICTIRALSSIILDRLKRKIHSVHEQQKSIYKDGLEKIEKLVRTINALIELNKMKISHIDQRSMITGLFNQFHQNFTILYDQWTNQRNTPRPSASASSTNHSVDPVPTTSVSSSRHRSEETSRKRAHNSSRSHHRSNEEDNDEKYSLFKTLLTSLNHLLDILHERRFISFSYLIEELISEVKSSRSTIKLSDVRSVYGAKQQIIAIESRLTNRINDEYRHAAPHGLATRLEHAFDKILDAIRHLLSSLDHYQSGTNKHKHSRTTHRSSPSDEKPTMSKSTQPKTRINRNDDDQSSDASRSSISDEVLMELARDAYEQRPSGSK